MLPPPSSYDVHVKYTNGLTSVTSTETYIVSDDIPGPWDVTRNVPEPAVGVNMAVTITFNGTTQTYHGFSVSLDRVAANSEVKVVVNYVTCLWPTRNVVRILLPDILPPRVPLQLQEPGMLQRMYQSVLARVFSAPEPEQQPSYPTRIVLDYSEDSNVLCVEPSLSDDLLAMTWKNDTVLRRAECSWRSTRGLCGFGTCVVLDPPEDRQEAWTQSPVYCLVDCSNSMHGDKMNFVRRLLELL